MQLDTALTAFSMTTLLIIVGLVVWTATDLGITQPVFIGNYYASIPEIGQVSREDMPLNMVEVEPKSPVCYQTGLNECRRLNAGENFITCLQKVTIDCSQTLPLLASCYLPAGFELKYNNNRDCVYGVMDECRARCAAGMQEVCNRMSSPRCSLIGGRFSSNYQQGKYTGYGMLT